MKKYILTNKDRTLFFEKDGVLSSNIDDAKRFDSENDAENKSIEIQIVGIPTKWIETVEH